MKQYPTSPPLIPVPLLTEVIEVNESLRPAVLPWSQKLQIKEAMESKHVHDALANEVIEKVQLRIAEMMPDLIRDAVDQVLKEHEPKIE